MSQSCFELNFSWFSSVGCPFCRSDIKGIENIVIDPFNKKSEENNKRQTVSTPSTPAEMMKAPFSGHSSADPTQRKISPPNGGRPAEKLPPRNFPKSEPQNFTRPQVGLSNVSMPRLLNATVLSSWENLLMLNAKAVHLIEKSFNMTSFHLLHVWSSVYFITNTSTNNNHALNPSLV